MTVKTSILSAAVALLIAQCNQLPTTPVTPPVNNDPSRFSNLSSDVLIDLPSCIAADFYNSNDVIYDGIRKYLHYANIVVNNDDWGVKAMIESWRNAINWKNVKEKAPNQVTDTLGGFTWSASHSPNDELHYHLTVVKNENGMQPEPVLTIDFNGSFKFPEGQIYYHLGRLEKLQCDSLEVKVAFGKKIGGKKTLDVAITGLEPEYDYDPEKVDLSLSSENGRIQMSGCSFHPDMDSILEGVKGHCYTFIGIVDPAENKSIINLGLPPASYDDTVGLFTTYGIADVWTTLIIEQEILTYPDTIKSIIATSYIKDLTADSILTLIKDGVDILVPPQVIENMTKEQFRQFLEKNQSFSNPGWREKLNNFLQVTNLIQPAYMDSAGHAGNGTNVPSGFNYLNDIAIELEAKIPSETAEMTIEP